MPVMLVMPAENHELQQPIMNLQDDGAICQLTSFSAPEYRNVDLFRLSRPR